MNGSEHPATAADYLAAWDRGESVWSIEMGGLGPGYEQAIQVLAIEIIRDNLAQPLPTDDAGLKDWGTSTTERVDYRKPDGSFALGGLSGAQVGAARTLAFRLLRDGPAARHESAPEKRRIQISKFWPKVEEAPQ